MLERHALMFSHWNAFCVLQYVHGMEMVQWPAKASTLNSRDMVKTTGNLMNEFLGSMTEYQVKVLTVPSCTQNPRMCF